jgi:hypothetical protein
VALLACYAGGNESVARFADMSALIGWSSG